MSERQLPFVTVIMPVRNEAVFIERSLGAVLAQDYPADRMEVIVADGMSDDGTRAIIENLKSQAPSSNGCARNLRVIDNPERIVSTGLNRALAQAQGEIIVRVDGHCEIAGDYIQNCVRHIQSKNVDGVGGSIETVGLTSVARAIAAAMSSRFGVGDSSFRTLAGTTNLADTIPFPAYTRTIIEKAGLYDEEQIRNQDDEYNYRLRKIGAKLFLAQNVRSRYYSRATLKGLAKQYFQYGFWKVRVMQKHPAQMRVRQFVPAVFVLSLLFSVVMLAVGYPLPFAVVTAGYVLANAGASVAMAGTKGFRLLPVLPLAFAILHVGYGSGFLWGLLRFWNRWKTPGNIPELKMVQQKASLSPADSS